MASPRITKHMREQIVKDTLNAQFGKEREDLKKKEAKLADRAYNDQYDKKLQKAMEALGKGYIQQSDQINVNIRGMKINLVFSGFVGLRRGGYDTNQAKRERRFVSREHGRCDKYFAPSTKLSDEIYDFTEEVTDFHNRVENAAVQLMAVLESVQSFKKLRVVWPQGEKFYDMYDVDSETRPGVPAVVVSDLNKALGIK